MDSIMRRALLLASLIDCPFIRLHWCVPWPLSRDDDGWWFRLYCFCGACSHALLPPKNNWATSATLLAMYGWKWVETCIHFMAASSSSATHLAPLPTVSCKQFNLFLFKTNLIATLQTLCSSRRGGRKVYTSATSASGRHKLRYSVRLHC